MASKNYQADENHGRAVMALIHRITAGGTERPAAVADHYRRQLAQGMMHDHRLAGVLSHVLSRPRAAEAAMAIAGSTTWTRTNFGRWLFEDYPRAVVFTPRRWRHRPTSTDSIP